MRKVLPVLLTTAAFAALMARSALAAEGARQGLAVCAGSLIPSLFPFYVLANLLSELGLADLLSARAGGFMTRLFRISGAGAQAFFLGLTGGYPLGASAAAQLRRQSRVSRQEAERLLAFCNNSGPAFILGAVGGVLNSPAAGALLYLCHVLAACAVGLFMRGHSAPPETPPSAAETPVPSFAAAFPRAAARAVTSTLAVCGYVVLFSALLGMLTPLQSLPPLVRTLCAGFLELGSGAAALRGLSPTPPVLAAASFLLGWGGLSVHCQTLSAVEGTDIRIARHLLGRAMCGVIAAVLTYVLAPLLGTA